MADFDNKSSDSDCDDSETELQEAFAQGLLKPGLNTVIEKSKRVFSNKVSELKRKANDLNLGLPWIETLDLVNAPAALAPELALQLQEHQIKRAKQLKNNAKLPQIDPEVDPVLNDFKREMIFHRQAQAAVMEGIEKLHTLGVVTKRPEDYFAQMAKTDEHMQKVRANLMAKQEGQAKSERVKQLREQRKMGKIMQKQAKVQKQTDKKEMLDQVKKFRKGMRDDLDFLDDNTGKKKGQGPQNTKPQLGRKALAKQKLKNTKYGFGGRKKGLKQNTKSSASDVTEYKRPNKPGQQGGARNKVPVKRLGKTKRQQNKAKGRK